MANATKPGSGYEIDIESSVRTGDGTYAIQWAYVWPVPGGWDGGATVSTEVKVTVHNRRRHSTERDISIDFDVLSDSVAPDVEAKLRDYAIGEEQRDWEYESRDLYPISALRAVSL
jgi:predicted RNA-binding protein with TRAM domain